MTNNIILTGVLKNIRYSHTTQDIEYYKADLFVAEQIDPIVIKFKKNNLPNEDLTDQLITIHGSLRSYSYRLPSGKNKVDLYVFTYFDNYKIISDITNESYLNGNICKLDRVRIDRFNGNKNLHITVENTIKSSSGFIKAYIPCIIRNDLIDEFLNNYNLYDKILIKGKFIPRRYKKFVDSENFEERLAYEVIVDEILSDEVQ